MTRLVPIRVLVLDDIQVLAGKERSQLELLETIDRVADGGGQVLLACDRRPADLEGIEVDDSVRRLFERAFARDDPAASG